MKDKFLSKAYGGVTEARRKLYGLGLPRQWKVITSTLLLLFTFAIGNVWADDYTFAASTFASDKLSATVDGQTFTFSLAHGGNGSNSYAGGQGGKYVKISTGKTETITFPSGFVATNLNIKGYTNKESTADGVKPNAEISEVAGVSQTGKTFPYRDLGSISEYDFAIAANATSVTFKTKGSTEQSCLLITITGTASGSATTYSITYECDGADSGCPAYVASATALPNPLPSAPVKDGFTFDGWYTNSTKTTAAVAGASLSADATLYAKWTENAPAPTPGTCPENGTIYKFVVKTGLTNGTVSETGLFGITTTNYLSSFTSTNGALQGYNNNSKFQIADNKSFKLTDKSNSYVKIDLGDCEFEKGDILKYIITSQNVEIYLSTAKTSAQKLTLTKSSSSTTYVQYALAEGDSPIGESVIYVYGASNSPQIYSFEVIRPLTITLDATTNGGTAVEAVKGAVGDKVVLPHAFKDGKKFKGWYDAATGGTKQANYYTVSAATTLYAQFEDLPTSGEMFKLTMESSMKPSTQVGLASKKTLDLLQYATITGGAAILENTTSSNDKGRITTSGECSFNDDGVLVTLTLDFPLAEGDVIEHVCNSSYELCYTATKTRSTAMSSSSKKYTVTDAADGLKGKSVIYVWRAASSDTKVTSIKVTRPIFRTITLEYADGVTPDGSLEVVDGEAATKPADPTWEHHRFDGWYNGATPYDWTANVTGDLTLTAHWTQLYTISFANGGGSGDAPAAVADKAQGETFEVPANTYDAPVDKVFAGWNDDTNDYAPGDTYTVGTANVVLTAQWINANFVARIGSTYYSTFADAIAAVADGQTIQLLQNCAFASAWTIEGKTVTLDMNGKNLTGPATGDAIDINTDGKLILKDDAATEDPTINGSNEVTYAGGKLTGKWPINVNAGGEFVMNGGWIVAGEAAAWVGYTGKVTINNGVLEAMDNAVVMAPGNAGKGGYTIDINGGILLGHITSSGYASACVYHPNTGVLNISGGTLVSTDGPAVVVRCGESHITGGTIISQGDGGKVGDASAVVPAVGVVYDFKANYPGDDINAAITAGNITSVAAIYAGTTPTTAEINAVNISGGTFSSPVAEALCAPSYVPETKANGKYGVIYPAQSIDFMAIIDAKGTGDEGKAELDAQLSSKHYDIDGTLNNDRLEAGGFKVKKTGLTISFSVEKEKVVEITTGHISGASIKVDDAAAVAMEGDKKHTYYSDDAQAFLITMTATGNAYNIFKSINIRDPFTVTFEAHGDADPAALQGKPSVILPSATNGTKSLTGWFTEETGGTKIGDATDEYTPTANITLHAQWEDISTDARLASIEFSAVGTLSPAFDPEVVNYTYTMPYGTADVPTITGATKANPAAKDPVIDAQAAAWGETAHVHGVAASDDTKDYYVQMLRAPKDGICIIKSTPTSGTEAAVDGIYQGSAYFKGNAKKLKNEYDYVGVELAAGYTFQAGDKVVLNQTAAVSGTDITKFYIFTEVPASGKTYVTVDNAAPVQGNNWFDMPAELVGRSALYIGRINNAYCNPTVGYLAVYRPLPPVLNKVTVNGVEGTPDNTNHVAIEVPASTADAALDAITYDWVSNSDAWTAAHAPVVANTWEFGVENTVTFTDKDGDASVYYVTISKAPASSDATLSALTVNGQAVALTDGVFDYSFELPYGTTVAPTVVATPNHVAAVATVDPCTLSGATITVVPESGAGDQQVYTLTFSISKWKEIVIWDGSYMSAVKTVQTEDIASWEAVGFTGVESWSYATDEPAGKVPAYCSDNDKTYTHVNSSGKNECNIFRTGGNTKNSRYFKITVPKDYVAKFYVVYGSHGEGTEVTMSIGNEASATASDGILSLTTDHRYLLSGGISEIVGAGDYYLNATASADFFEIRAYLRPGHARTAMLGNGVLGTVCVPNNVAIEDIQGATFYELQGRDYTNYGKLAFDEIISGGLEAGVPYVFLAHGDKLVLFYGETSEPAPVDKGNGMYGTFTDQTLTELNDVYYFAQKALWGCADLTSLSVPANRAYVKLSEVGSADPNPAPGRRRISMAVNGEQIATGIENTGFESEAPRKVLINGELFIIRGEKMYDAKGQLVK